MPKKIIGFSKLSREEKIDWLSEKMFDDSNQVKSILDNYLNSNKDIQAIHDSFSENSISNFYLPYSVSPNFLINDKIYTVPLVTEESSVVAALSNAAKFWFDKGGFKTEVQSFTKKGQIHFSDRNLLKHYVLKGPYVKQYRKFKTFIKQTKIQKKQIDQIDQRRQKCKRARKR